MLDALIYVKPVSYGYVVKLLDVRRHTLYSLGDTALVFIVSAPIPTVDRLCIDVQEAVLERLAREAERERRSKHLQEKRRPWSPVRTKAPLSDAAARRARSRTLKDYLRIAEAVVERLGDPWNPSTRGRKPIYSPKKLVAVILVKEVMGMSFEKLSSELRDIGYDARTEEAKRRGVEAKSPCPSHLHWVFMRIPEAYLRRALRLLDRMAVEEHTRLFGEEHLSEYSIDSTEDRCDTLEEVGVAMRTQLHHQTVRYSILTRLVTNTVAAITISRNTKDARPLLRHVPPGSTVYMDSEYDVEYNYEYGSERGITLIVRPKLYDGKPYKGYHRRQALRGFSRGKYRRRKLAERPIGNRAARDGGTLNYRRPDTRRKGLILKYIAHNMRALSTQHAWPELLQPTRIT